MVRYADVVEKWKFTGIDLLQLIDQIYNLLSYFKHSVTYYGILVWLDQFITVKKPMIETMMTSPHYNGNLQIINSDTEFHFALDVSTTQRYFDRMVNSVDREQFVHTVNDDGKTMRDCRLNGLTNSVVDINSLPIFTDIAQWNNAMEFMPTVTKYQEFCRLLKILRSNGIGYETIEDSLYQRLADEFPEYHIHKGALFGRTVNAIFAANGVDKNRAYQQAFAEFSNVCRSRTQKVMYVISLHPIDFLCSSFGVSWSSCHTIDKSNKRGIDSSHTYSGMRCGGNLSYSLDQVTSISYTISIPKQGETITYYDGNKYEISQHPEMVYKIYRQWHYGQFASPNFVAGRLYPQNNDGLTGVIARKEMQKYYVAELALMGNMTNWDDGILSTDDDIEALIQTNEQSTQYPDYDYRDFRCYYYSDINHPQNTEIEIGARQIDLWSGASRRSENSLSDATNRLPIEYQSHTNFQKILL